MSHPEQSPRKTVRFIHANPTTVTIPPPPTSDSASSISSSVASESSTQPLLSSAETHRRQSQRPTSSAKPRSRSPSPSTAHVTTTTNSKETSPPNHRRLMHFLLHQKKYARDPQTGESSQSAQGNVSSSSEKDRENGLKKSKRVFIPPPPLPQQYGTVSGSECGLGPCRENAHRHSTSWFNPRQSYAHRPSGASNSTTSSSGHGPHFRFRLPLKPHRLKWRHRFGTFPFMSYSGSGEPKKAPKRAKVHLGSKSPLVFVQPTIEGENGSEKGEEGEGTPTRGHLERKTGVLYGQPYVYGLRYRRGSPPPNLDGLDESEKLLEDDKSPKTSPLYHTTSRKKLRQVRMAQGPHEYQSWKDIMLDFCARTSSHGVPFIGTHSFFGRILWMVITLLAFFAFCIQTYYTLSDYLSYRTIIEMQLKFEPAPFPAATICNLNSFKFSELRKFEEIEQGFKLWEKAISTLEEQVRLEEAERALLPVKRRKRRNVTYRPIYVKCVCNLPDDQCVPQRNVLDLNASVCLCYQDERTGDIWPCYAKSAWIEKTCFHCSTANTCDDPDKPPNITTLLTEPRERDCLCQSISHYCLARDPNHEIMWWNPNNYTSWPATEPPPLASEVEEAFGLEDLRDRGAITTKTKENLIFLVAAMPRETREQLSYTLDEFVLRCSFNSKDCDLKRDFQIQIDPEYGNCYTFNFNDSVELKNSRAGPMYGLRLLLNVNQSDYMPTTEAAGVRIVVHEQDQEPFPDTFGYSAPTGFISSFGLKAKMLSRIDSPYGKCSDTFRPENYIYAEHYSPEGCYRNCFQQIIVARCGCGDPRFPLPQLKDEVKPCDAKNHRERMCLANETSVLGGFHHLTHDCHCVQPCSENVFETAYSAAAWPATNFNIGADCVTVLNTENFTREACAEYYRQNTAYIEIYYEQLNFESLRETAGYTMVNLFSDLGGNIGLWIGFSLITVLEFVELLCECIVYGCEKCVYNRLKKRQRRARTMNALVEAAVFSGDRRRDEERHLQLLAEKEEKIKDPPAYYSHVFDVKTDTPTKPIRSSLKRREAARNRPSSQGSGVSFDESTIRYPVDLDRYDTNDQFNNNNTSRYRDSRS